MYPEYEDDLKLFELSEGASLAALKTSYQTLLKVWHPDRFPNDEKLKKKANAKVIEIKDAHDRLSTCFKFRDQQKRKSSKTSAKKKSVKPPPKDSRPIVGIVVVGIISVFGLLFNFAALTFTDNNTEEIYRLIPAMRSKNNNSNGMAMLVHLIIIIGVSLSYLNHEKGKLTVRVGCYIWCVCAVWNWFSYSNLQYDQNFIIANRILGGAPIAEFTGAFYWIKLILLNLFVLWMVYLFREPDDWIDRLVKTTKENFREAGSAPAWTPPKSKKSQPAKSSSALLTTTAKPRTKKSKKSSAPYTPPREKRPRKTKAQKQKEEEQHAFDVRVMVGVLCVFALLLLVILAFTSSDSSSSSKSQSAASEMLANSLAITDDDIYDGNVDAVKQYLNNGGDPHLKSENGESTLVNLAVAQGKLEIAQLFIDSGVDVNLSDQDSWTLLHSAASNGHLEIVDYLIIEGTSVNAVDKYNSSPVNETAKHRQALAGLALLDANANPNTVDVHGAFTLTYLMNHVEIQSGFETEHRTNMERFFIACLANGADPNISDYKTKLSCLDLAYKMKNEGLADVLKFYGGKESKNSPYTRKGIKGFFNRLKD